MQGLLIGKKELDDIAEVKKYAEENPFNLTKMQEVIEQIRPTPGDMKEFTCYIPFGFTVVYSIEHQGDIKLRHLSVSIKKHGKLPVEGAVLLLMKQFGFKSNKVEDATKVWIEKGFAVNVLEVIE